MTEQHVADVVLSAERAVATTRRTPVEVVRVRREVVTEHVTVTVAVRREVLRIERVPLQPADGPGDVAGAAGAAEHADGSPELPVEVVLSQERPLVSFEVVPYERVVLDVRTTATTTPVSTTTSREVLEVTTEPSDGRSSAGPTA